MRKPWDLCFCKKNFCKFGSWLLVVLVMSFLSGCAKPESAITKNYEIDMQTKTGSNVVILVLDADVESSTAVKQDAKADAKAVLSPAGKIGEAAAGAGDLLEAGKRLPEMHKEDVVPDVKEHVPAPVSGDTTEKGIYHGRFNGSGDGKGSDPEDRPTWYYSKKMREYPLSFTFRVDGCSGNLSVDNNGTRWVSESNDFIVKQSDVSGRGMAVIGPKSCFSKTASINYTATE